jgi:glucoamylase
MSEIRTIDSTSACLHCGVAIARAALVTAAAAALALVLVSGGSNADPRTPPALPGLPPPFLGTAVTGDGGMTVAVDAYGDVVDLRPVPAGPALIANSSARQAAGTVAADTGIVPRVRVGEGKALPLWRADEVRQRYLRGTNVVRTVGRFGGVRAVVTTAGRGEALGMTVRLRGTVGVRAAATVDTNVEGGERCRERGAESAGLELLCWRGRRPDGGAASLIARAAGADRRWVGLAKGLGAGAPRWARAMYRRSLLVLHTLTDGRTGAVAAGARDGWAYVWPRDAATAAMAYAAAGYRSEARRVAGFLENLGARTSQAARFSADGSPVPGRGPQGDAPGWIAAAARAAGLPPSPPAASAWRNHPDYQESSPGTYLGNALASTATPSADGPNGREYRDESARRADGPKTGLYLPKSAHRREEGRIAAEFGTPRGLVREAGDAGSGLDSAAAWAVRPFSSPALYPAARRTLLDLASHATPFGITPGEGWRGGTDPWTAPTAWSAWSLATLGDRAAALRLLADLRRAATQAGALPERVGAHTGIPRSTTPLAWSHAFAILALRQLWPQR